ncbi:glycerophosphoryl diester phosphodiesterase [Sporobacter termitidis DSM 10068]|uniref:Glycerophosphoryl diester phosphodiesterase n=1 Tax=Sporobacter termitidis DSM 10068 TaxID=1123282 RepID=A0A1M5ZBQ2_9FIRM|nr:glycerophosphodiester phosphodiesterase [Sporobacter termitidis]SHI21599.1 glycerophosphoryl diester phosphodiesterase [Sporobacter termitidis DSM 10068]
MMFPAIIGHRGVPHLAPENTMASFKLALESGADGLETDVQMTKDGELVLIHDELLERTTDGTGLVATHTLGELRALDAGGWFSPEFKGERIPTLREFLEFVSGRDLLVNIEIKSGVVLYPGIEQELIALLRAYGVTENVIISSFNHYSLVACKEIDGAIKTGILYMCGMVNPWVYAKSIGADALHPLFYSVRSETIGGMKDSGLLINPYTVDAPRDMRNMIGLGVDSIITNYCDVLRRIKDGDKAL